MQSITDHRTRLRASKRPRDKVGPDCPLGAQQWGQPKRGIWNQVEGDSLANRHHPSGCACGSASPLNPTCCFFIEAHPDRTRGSAKPAFVRVTVWVPFQVPLATLGTTGWHLEIGVKRRSNQAGHRVLAKVRSLVGGSRLNREQTVIQHPLSRPALYRSSPIFGGTGFGPQLAALRADSWFCADRSVLAGPGSSYVAFSVVLFVLFGSDTWAIFRGDSWLCA